MITINLGSRDNVKKNDPVITSAGLVGKILQPGRTSSLCQLLTDRNFKVSAITRSTNTYGHLRWYADDTALMDNVNKSSVVMIGDTVVTSQHGNIYPEGIPIGVVKNFEDGPELFKDVYVKLFVDYVQLKDVAVIVNVKQDSLDGRK